MKNEISGKADKVDCIFGKALFLQKTVNQNETSIGSSVREGMQLIN